jgi:hypothetical protein
MKTYTWSILLLNVLKIRCEQEFLNFTYTLKIVINWLFLVGQNPLNLDSQQSAVNSFL